MRFIIEHTSLHYGWPEFIVMLAMICVLAIVWKKLKKRKETHEKLEEMVKELAETTAEAVPEPSESST